MMDVKYWIEIIISILSGLAVCIPLVIKLVNTIQGLAKEKNWNALVEKMYNLMAEAEQKFVNGATKKEWVMGMMEVAARSVNYDYDDEAEAKISKMIDDSCTLAKELVKIDKR